MENLKHKNVLITGASSGIGEATAEIFAKQGTNLILAARRINKLNDLANRLMDQHAIKVHTLALNVMNKSTIDNALMELPDTFKPIDILINNAGLALGRDPIHEGDTADWDIMIDTNIKGLLYMTKAILPQMLKHEQGHIINIGSLAGHHVYSGGTVYCATKHAERAITEGTFLDVKGTPIRVTSIDPGLTETEFSLVRYKGNQKTAQRVYENMSPLTPQDIAESILFVATRPPNVNIAQMLVLPTNQP